MKQDINPTYKEQALQHELISPSIEKRLIKKAQNGDKRARDRLVKSNQRLVVHLAQRYLRFGVPIDDLIQQGNIGLLKAIDTHDPTYRLSTHATNHIRKHMMLAVENQAEVNQVLSLDRTVAPGHHSRRVHADALVDTIPDEDAPESQDYVDEGESLQALSEALSGINKRHRETLWRHHVEDESITEISEDFGLSRQRQSKINHSGTCKLLDKLLFSSRIEDSYDFGHSYVVRVQSRVGSEPEEEDKEFTIGFFSARSEEGVRENLARIVRSSEKPRAGKNSYTYRTYVLRKFPSGEVIRRFGVREGIKETAPEEEAV